VAEKELRQPNWNVRRKVGRNGKRQLSHPDYQLIPDGDDVDAAVSRFTGNFSQSTICRKISSWKIT
jgi:hypothetical protein